jgi:hypothetical protein
VNYDNLTHEQPNSTPFSVCFGVWFNPDAQTVTTTRPIRWFDSRYRRASAYRTSEKLFAITTFNSLIETGKNGKAIS